MAKGLSLQDMSAYALAFVVIAVILGVTATILTQVKSTQCTDDNWNATTGECLSGNTTIASNATGYGITGTGTMSQWLPIIAVIIAAAIVIGIIVTAFRG